MNIIDDGQGDRSDINTNWVRSNDTNETIHVGVVHQVELPLNFEPNQSDTDDGVMELASRRETKRAKEKRDSYRTKSSGYGTGSSQESCGKSQEMLTNEVFEDIYTASRITDVLRTELCDQFANLTRLGARAETSSCWVHSQRGSLASGSSSNSNDTVIVKPFVFAVKESISDMNDIGSDESARYQSQALENQMANTERLRSDQELSFEIRLPESDVPCETQAVREEPRQSDNTDFNSLFEGNINFLKYISEQQNPPIYAPSGENAVAFSLKETISEPSQMSHYEEFLSSLLNSEDSSISSIVPSKEGHVPISEMEKMFNSAMRRWDKQIQQEDLQKLLTAIDNEETVDNIYLEMEKLNLDSEYSLHSIKTAKLDRLPSDMDTIDKFVRQIVANGEDLSPTAEGATADSVDPSHLMCNFPEKKFVSPQMPVDVKFKENQELLLQRLQMAALCLDKSCNDVECSLGQELLDHLEDRLEQNLTYESASCQQMLKSIAWHAELCEEIKCPLPYCQFFQETDIPFSEQIARLQQTLYSGFTEITDPPSKSDLFWKISTRIPVDKALQEGVDWSLVSRMGHFGRGPYLVQSSIYQLDIPEYWVVKKISMNEDTEKVLEKARLFKSLSALADDHVIHFLWLLYQESSLYVCSQLEGMSVSECLRSKEFERGLGREITLSYLQQLISAVRYLHKKNTLYLNWTGDHIVVENDRIKLCNLANAVQSNGISYDEDMLEDIMMTLPPHVLPPELLAQSGVGEFSDIWGLGCIVHEMYSGCKVHNHLRHWDLSSQRSEILKSPKPELKGVKDGKLLNILNSCFQVNYEKRPSLSALQILNDRLIGTNS